MEDGEDLSTWDRSDLETEIRRLRLAFGQLSSELQTQAQQRHRLEQEAIDLRRHHDRQERVLGRLVVQVAPQPIPHDQALNEAIKCLEMCGERLLPASDQRALVLRVHKWLVKFLR